MSIHRIRWFTLPLVLAGSLLLAASAQASGTAAKDESLDRLIDAVTEIHAQRTQMLAAGALPENSPVAGRTEDLLPPATGSAMERSADFLARIGKHGLAVDVDLSRRVEALMPEWLIAPQTLTSADQTAKAHLLVNELQTVFAESVSFQHALQIHVAAQLDAIWRDEPARSSFMAGYAKGRAKHQPIFDELQANRRRLARSIRDLLEFADTRRQRMTWDEDAEQLLMETDEDVIVYTALVEQLRKASAQEETLVALLMTEVGASLKQAQDAE